MKKIILLLFSLLSSNLFFAQSKNTNLNQNSETTQTEYERCSTMKVYEENLKKNPNAETLEQFENWLQQKIREGAITPHVKGERAIITIPYIIHVIHNGEAVGTASNIPSSWITAQMAAMNRDFRYNNADKVNLPAVFQPVAADFELEFCPAVVDPTGNVLAEPGVDRVDRNLKGFSAPPYSTTTFDASVKPATIWNPDNYFNIWTANVGSSLLGYATFPSTTLLSGLTSSIGTATTDGVVISYLAFGDLNPGLTANFNRGRTLVHEAGHWLGLRHIWGDGSCATDYCNDTPTQSTSNTGCPTFPKVTCTNGPNGDMFYNYMDYSYDACMYCFTADQKTRAVTIMNNSPRRLSLQSSTVCALPGINVGVLSISPPCETGTGKTVSVTIKNKGISDINPGEVSMVLNVSGGVTGSYSAILNTTTIATNATETLVFTNVNVNSTANITLQAVATLSGDTYVPDNTLSSTVNLAPPAITSSVALACSGTAFTLTLTNPNASATLQWQNSANGTTFTNIASATAATASVSQTAATYYRMKTTCNGTDYFSNVVQVGMDVVTNCYCSTTYSSGCSQGDQITKVVLGTLTNSSACAASPYYTFYSTATIPTLTRTVASSISVTFGSDANQYCAVWIDHNNDGTFATTEMMTNNTVKVGANGTFVGSMTIPAGTFTGQTRMRVRGGNDSALTSGQACGTSSSNYGETEDYIVNIIQPCSAPTLGAVTTITTTSATAPFTCTSCAGSYIVEYGTSGFTPGTGATAGTGGTVITSTTLSVNLTGLTPGTTYDVYVRQSCAGNLYSANAPKATFSTLCGTQNLPYADGFNGATLSSCWQNTVATAGAVAPTITVVTTGGTPAAVVPEGARMLRFNSATASVGAQSRLISTTFNTTGINKVDVSFQMLENDQLMSNIDKLTLQYSTDNGATWNNVADNVRPNLNTGTSRWYTRSFTLPSDAGNQTGLKVGLLFTSALGNNIYFDDFKIYASPVFGNLNDNNCNVVTVNNVSGYNTFRFKNGVSTFAEINPNGVNLGTVTLNVKENLAGSANVPALTSNGKMYLPRYFNINSTTANPFPQTVNVKLLFHYNEIQDFNNASNSSESIGTLTVWEYDDPNGGTTENCNPNDNVVASTKLTNVLATDLNEGFSLEFNTNHFTEYGAFGELDLPLSVNLKVLLNNTNATTALMPTDVLNVPNFPISDPYTTAPLSSAFIHVNNPTVSTTNAIALSQTGNNAIADWVFIELRSGASGATTALYTKAALLQADGDVVDMDGVSPLAFPNAPIGSYYVAVRHRNHLGFRTQNTVALSAVPVTLNFVNNSVPVFGASPLSALSPTVNVMVAGDANSDGSIDAFDTITWELQNGLFDDYTKNADYNLDGSVDAFDTILWELNNGKFQELD